MISVEDEETKFSAVLGLDVTQTAQIPKDIRKVLFERFTEGKKICALLLTYLTFSISTFFRIFQGYLHSFSI